MKQSIISISKPKKIKLKTISVLDFNEFEVPADITETEERELLSIMRRLSKKGMMDDIDIDGPARLVLAMRKN